MTHMTDQERAEFEAWWREEMNVEVMDLARTAYPMTPPEKQMYKCHETERAWLTWQAARRAQVVPQGWKLVPVEPTKEWVSALVERGVHIGTFIRDILAAAPQPPEETVKESLTVEAAPVQLPEPFALAFRFETEESGPTETSFYPSDRIGMGWTSLYTEHQVRQLLAAQQFTLDELAMLTRKLVQQLRKASPGDESAEKALDYLKRKGLAGNPLRATKEPST